VRYALLSVVFGASLRLSPQALGRDVVNFSREAFVPNPVMPLTKAEEQLVAELNKTKTRDWVLGRLKTDLQIAIEIELATIPIYLYTYYSIVRNATSGEDVDPVQT